MPLEFDSSLIVWLVYIHLFLFIGPGALIGAASLWNLFQQNYAHKTIHWRPARKSYPMGLHRA